MLGSDAEPLPGSENGRKGTPEFMYVHLAKGKRN